MGTPSRSGREHLRGSSPPRGPLYGPSRRILPVNAPMNESLLPVDVAGVHDHRSNENRPTLKLESSGARRAMAMAIAFSGAA